MTNTHTLYLALIALSLTTAAVSCTEQQVSLPQGKAIYIPADLRDMDLQSDQSTWSYRRMRCTPNLAIFWQRGFGQDLASAPPLDGHPMTVDLPNLEAQLERFYTYYRDSLHFCMPTSRADSTRMMVMLNYSLEGTAYGGCYDDSIGALWIAPNRIQDHKLNCIAHELGHSFQCQIGADRAEREWQAYGFYEMASQWMLWQVNPEWITDESYHFEAFSRLTHRAFLHIDNIYHSPYILQYWSDVRGRDVIGRLFREGRNGEDALMVYKRLFQLSQQDMCDEMFEACRHIVGLDYQHARGVTRQYTGHLTTPLQADSGGWLSPDDAVLPENYGFNVIPIDSALLATRLVVRFEGLTGRVTASYRQYAGWRYGFVAETSDGYYHYSPAGALASGTLSYLLPAATRRAWLVVMGAPSLHWRTDTPDTAASIQWPYRFSLHGD